VARQQARRHQRERIAGIVVVCLGILVLGVAILALREPNGHVTTAGSQRTSASSVAKQTSTGATHATSPAKTTAPGSASSAPKSGANGSGTKVKDVPLVVLNNTSVQGLASQAAQRFESGGWTVTESGNLTNVILSTCAYYDESQPGARAAAEALQQQYPTIKRVEPKFPELPAGPVVVVLTPDYTAG
jgi:hypothetical protein